MFFTRNSTDGSTAVEILELASTALSASSGRIHRRDGGKAVTKSGLHEAGDSLLIESERGGVEAPEKRLCLWK
jgi:hypothetical protein